MLPQGPYNPTETEKKVLEFWLSNGYYKPEYNPAQDKLMSTEEMKADPREPWALICPPPNAYARPHIGNISGYAYQDAMARFARMQGKKVLVIPGKDHAGLEGEGVFVRDVLDKQGRSKFDMTRDDFYKEIYEFNMQNKAKALDDEKRIGLSADFERDIFTLDPRIVNTVLNTFIEMYKSKMIYKGVRIINWDPKARTAVADNQTVREERDGKLYYIKYPLVKQRVWKLSFYMTTIFDRIRDGKEIIETRALNPDEKDRYFGNIKAGDIIICLDKSDRKSVSIYKKVKSTIIYKNFDEVLEKMDQENVFGRKYSSPGEIKAFYNTLAEGYGDKIEQNGLIAIEMEDLADDDYLTVATTRPETLLGDTAVAMNPSDKRYLNLKGKQAIVPLVDRIVPIISSYKVEEGFGTGFLKVTPAHSQDDYQIMIEWNTSNNDQQISAINVIDSYLKLCGPVPAKYLGMKYKEALPLILEDLKINNLCIKEEPVKQNILKAERTGALIEPIMSSQWYLKYDTSENNLKEEALNMVKEGRVKIHPKSMEDKFNHWMNNLRDWAISRSLWWGYRIPVWYHGEVKEIINENGEVTELIKVSGSEEWIPLEYNNSDHLKVQLENPGNGWQQDENVLDTWFSSGQWVYATLEAWNLKDIFFPTQVLVSASDILENWDSRMMMFTYFHDKNIPFENLFLTGLVLGTDGQKMSKSKGNMIDMDKVVAEFGSDAIRMTYFYQNSAGGSYSVTPDKLKNFKQFNNKLWNAARFVLTNYENALVKTKGRVEPQTDFGKKLLDHITKVKEKVTKNIQAYEFGYATETLYDEFWHNFCDILIEESKGYITKRDFKTGEIISKVESEVESEVSGLMVYVLKEYLKMLHPFIPFITQDIWNEVPKSDVDHKVLMYSRWEYSK